MSSSHQSRRRRQQASFRRHQLRLEGLEKRYALNAAPVLDPSASPQLNSVVEDAGIPVGQVGTLVSDLIDTGGTHNNFSDVNGHLPGIAITETNLQGGSLYYSTDNGITWADVGVTSEINYRLLHADLNTRLAFVPPENFQGTIADVLSIKAWDRSGSTNGSTTLNLDTDYFSLATDTLSIQVDAGPNEAPIYPKLISPYPGLEPTREQGVDPVGPVGTLVSDMIDSDGQYKNFYDPDGDLPGVAITGCSSDVGGVWFSLDDGLTWTDAGVPTESSALLLHVDNSTRIFLKRNSIPIDPASSSATVGVGAKLWDRRGGFSSGQTGVDTTAADLAYFTGDPVAAVSLDGSFAVVGGDRVLSFSPYSGIQSIRIYDLSSPESPTLMSEFELDVDLVWAVEMSPDSRTVYVVGNRKVQVIDISNRSAPATLAIFANTPDIYTYTHDIALSSDGNIAYVGVSNSRLKVFSVSQPSNPILLGSFADTYNHGTSVAISPDGQYAYLCGRKLQVIDISATSSPTLVLEMPLPSGHFFYPDDVEIAGDGNTIFVAYINSYGEGLVEIVDVSSPINPTVQATIDAPAQFSEIVLSADSSTLYAPGSNFRPTYVFDVRDPSNPSLARSINHAFDWLSSDEQFLYSERGDYGAVETFGVRVFDNVGSELPFSVQTRGFSSPVVRAPLLEGFSVPNGSIWDGHPVTVTANGHFIDADATVTLSSTGTILNSHSVKIFHNFDHLELSVTHTVASSYTDQIVTIENPDGQTHSLSYSVGQVNYATDNLSVITGNFYGILNEQGNAMGRIQWSDNEGHSLDRVAVSSHGDHGRVSLLSLGSNQWAWSYVPKSSFVDSDTFRLRFTDDLGYLTDQFFTVQGSVNLEPIEWSMVINQNVVGSIASYTIAAMDVFGQRISGGVTQITATSSDDSLIQNPSTIYAETNFPSSLSFTPVADANGTATLSIQVEDGGPDNDFATTEDNRQATHQVEVTVLEVVSNSGSAILAKDSSGSLYVNTQPVIYNQQQVPQAIFGSSVVGADTSDSENALLLQPLGTDAEEPTHRLLTDETWRINDIFNSLQNASSPVLDLSGREVSGALNIAAVAGAYEINGVNNPTLVVRRGQTYTFNLNTAGHPFWLQTTGSGYQSANVYDSEFTGNSQTTGEHQWVVPQDAPDEIFYQCEFHPVMFGKIIVVD